MKSYLLPWTGKIAAKWPRNLHAIKSVEKRFRNISPRTKHTSASPLTVLSEDEELFQNSVAKFARMKVQPKVQEMESNGKMDDELIREMFKDGIMSIEIPAEFGGSGASFFNVCLAVEELSKVDPSVSVLCDLQNTVINNSLMQFGSMSLKKKYLPQLAKKTIGSFCLTEPDSGSDAFSLKTEAKKSTDGSFYTLNGQKMWISNAGYAGLFLVFATVDSSQGHKGITCFIVDRNSEGIEIGKAEDKLGIRASSTCPVYLHDVRVDSQNIIGDVGQGYKIAMSTLNEGRIGIASQMLGLAQGVYDQTMPYLFDRHQFGSPVGDFQAVQHQYAELALGIENARLLVYNAARRKDASYPFMKEASMAKLYCSRIAEQTASKCIDLLGGVGFTKGLFAEKFFRDSKIGAIYEGTSNIQLSTIAKIIKDDYKR